MAKNDYTYDNGKTRKGRVNVWELEKRVKKLETQIPSRIKQTTSAIE